MRRSNPSFLNGVPELLILRCLALREMYGYELVKQIQARSQETFRFGEGCIYPTLHYLEATKLVSSRRCQVEGRSRHYYRLTTRGRKRLEELTQEWNQVTAGVAAALNPEPAGAG